MACSFRGRKIIIVFWGSELGGAERQGLLLARFLKYEQNAEVRVWGLGANVPGRVTELCAEYGLPWQGVNFEWPNTDNARLRVLFHFGKSLKKEKPDILLPYTMLPNVVCGLVWRFIGVKTCLWNQRDQGLGLNAGLWDRLSVRLTSRFVSNSTIGKEALAEIYGINKDSIRVIHNGVSLDAPIEDRATWRKRLKIDDHCFVTTMVANLHEYKDHPTLLVAWKKLLECSKDNLCPSPMLLLAGRFDDSLRANELKAMAFDLELGKSVKFLGKVDDIAGLLMASDLYVHSSKSEGLPNSVLEAMAAGLPVIGSNISGIREAVGPENHRYLVDAEDVNGFADMIVQFINNNDVCKDVGSQNRHIAENKFSVMKMCREMSELIYQ
jgi:glycosyltransferase involved in cell wall biosynthesis